MKRIMLACVLTNFLLIGNLFAEDVTALGGEASGDTVAVELAIAAEAGFVKSLVHTIQIGQSGYFFDYVQEGGQEILLPYYRYELQILAAQKHEIGVLYQPLTLQTRTRVDQAGGITIDDVTFDDDSPLDLQYGFDFYRFTYRYRMSESPSGYVSLGGALQLRNASIIFDGYEGGSEARVVSQDLGFVPVISFAMRRNFANGFFLESSLDGFYAPVRYLNLDNVDVIGWLYDAAVRLGTTLQLEGLSGQQAEAYISMRALGGGADGTGGVATVWTQSRDTPRYTWNNLNLLAFTAGLRY
jgi:hypothetical protein